jgi:hypothetical protein
MIALTYLHPNPHPNPLPQVGEGEHPLFPSRSWKKESLCRSHSHLWKKESFCRSLSHLWERGRGEGGKILNPA